MLKFTIKQAKNIKMDKFLELLTEEQAKTIKEMGYSLADVHELYTDGAKLADVEEEEEYVTIEEYIKHLKEMQTDLEYLLS